MGLRPDFHTKGKDLSKFKFGFKQRLTVIGILLSILYVVGINVAQGQTGAGTFLSRLTLGAPTGPTPVLGQENASAPYLVNGTPIVPSCTDNKIIVENNAGGSDSAVKCNSALLTTATPSNNSTLKVNNSNTVEFDTATPTFTSIPTVTPAPTCAADQLLGGTGGQGIQCEAAKITTATPSGNSTLKVNTALTPIIEFDTPTPTFTPIPTATPELYLQATTATPAPSTYLFYAGTPGPAVWVTVVPTTGPPSAPTAFPTCAIGVFGVGTGAQGLQCGSSALSTATPAAGTIPYCSVGGAGCVLSYVTPSTGSTTITQTPLGSPVTMTLANTFYQILDFGALTGSYALSANAEFNGNAADQVQCLIGPNSASSTGQLGHAFNTITTNNVNVSVSITDVATGSITATHEYLNCANTNSAGKTVVTSDVGTWITAKKVG